MDKSNNKKRLLALIDILRKKSDENTRLSLQEITDYLKEQDIEVNNRKTLYDDFKILNEYNINIEYDNGYYLLDAPFNLSEIKIIQDSINSLKNLDNKMLTRLNQKLNSFISDNDEILLKKITYSNKHSDSKLLQHMEDIILAIKNNTSIIVKNRNKETQEIFPLFIHRNNDYYYFYYHYPNSKKIYHYRFDNIFNIEITSNKDDMNINYKDIISNIEESSNAYSKGKAETIKITLLINDEKLINQFLDDFPNSFRTNDGFALKADINNIFFSKLVSYHNAIKIENKDIALKYKNFLKTIIKIY